MSSLRSWIFHLRRSWGIAITFGTIVFSAADQFLPMFQDRIPPMAYAGIALGIALLPSILNRRTAKCNRRERCRAERDGERRCPL